MDTLYIDRKQSNIIKGICILLIILGHNHILAPEGSKLFRYLYSFHVHIFFILPFFYNKPLLLNKDNLLKTIIRSGVPYLYFYIFSYFLFHFILNSDGFYIIEFLGGLVKLPGYTVKTATGFQFLWFLPVFLLMSIFRLIVSRSKLLMYTLMFVGLLFSVNDKIHGFMWNSPLYVLTALNYYAMGLIAFLIYNKILSFNYIGTVIFICFSILFFTNIYKVNLLLFSIAGFYCIKELTNISFLWSLPIWQLIGKYSLPIYLTNVYVYNILERLLPNTVFFGIIIYFLTIVICLLLSICIYRIDSIRRIIFPKSFEELINNKRNI